MPTFATYTDHKTCKHLLFYLYRKYVQFQLNTGSIEVICPFDLLKFDKLADIKPKQLKELGVLYTLGEGVYDINVEQGARIRLEIRNFINGKKMLHNYSMYDNSDFTRQVIIECESRDILDSLYDESKDFVESFRKEFINSYGNLKKYIYDAKDSYWNEAHATHYRALESLFLKKGEKERLVEYVDDFTDPETREDYIKFNIPYKSNILLYGKPGTGKTSTIMTIASHLKTNIGIIPISTALDDTGLINALSDVKKKECKVVVIEDIDCLFTDRKIHDSERNSLTLSGLLNCMDGFFRAEGTIIFLTTNDISVLDDALIRSARIDWKLEYTDADEYQIKNCFAYYFPKQKDNFQRFYDSISHYQFSIADLQQFFFKYRKSENILDHLKELLDTKKAVQASSNTLYI